MADSWDWNGGLTRRSMLRGAGVAGAGIAAAALIGCGDDDDDDDGGGSGDPKQGGTMVSSNALSFEAYGPSGGPFGLFTGEVTSTEHSGIWDSLMLRRDTIDPEPRLAESWVQNADFTSTEVKLHPDLTFHNGKPLDAEAVKASYESMSAEGTSANQTGTLANRYLESIEVVDNRTIRFNHPQWPGPVIFDLLTLAPIHDADNLPDYYETKEVNASGPFKFDLDSWKPGESWLAVAHENYPFPPNLDAIEYRVVADDEVRALALESGEIDLAKVAPAAFQRLSGLDHLRVHIGNTTGMFIIGAVGTLLGGGHPANDDPRFLRAISLGLDRESIKAEVFEGINSIRSQYWFPYQPQYDAKYIVPYDPEGARALLEEAGLVGTEIDLFYFTGEFPDSFPEALQADMKEIGIEVTLVEQDVGTFFDGFLLGTMPGWYTTGFGFSWMEPETFLNTNFQVRTTNDLNSVANVAQDYLDLVAAFAEQPTPAERTALLDQFNERFAERPQVIPVVGGEDVWAINDRVKGEPVTVGANRYFLNELWIDA